MGRDPFLLVARHVLLPVWMRPQGDVLSNVTSSVLVVENMSDLDFGAT